MCADRGSGAGRLGSSRRQFLLGGAAAGLGAAVAIGADLALNRTDQTVSNLNGESAVQFYGKHQAGITVAPQSHTTVVALDLHDGVDRDALRRMMRVVTDDIVRMMEGRPALGDMEPSSPSSPLD